MEATDKAPRERVWLVATSSVWIAGFKGLFGDPCGVDTVVVSLTEALAQRGQEIVLIDSGASSVNGKVREVVVQFRQWAPTLRPIVVSHGIREDDDYIEGIIRAGASGHLSSSASVEEFRAALDNVRDGSIWAPRKVLSRLVQTNSRLHLTPARDRGVAPVHFTPREEEVIRMLVGGHRNREIGANLGIDPVTVKAHLGRIMRKAGVGNRIELTMFALGHLGNANAKSVSALLQRPTTGSTH